MSTPTIARLKPYLVRVEEGKRYFWCACGRSKNQPYCDGSHKDTDFLPLAWRATATEEKLFCGCKRTGAAPFCDGTHNRLSDTYAEAEPEDGAAARLVDYEATADGALKANLDNGCYVVRVPPEAMSATGDLLMYPVIGTTDGAEHISQYLGIVHTGQSPVLRYRGSDVVLFISAGSGTVEIGDRTFPVSPDTGVCIKPDEGFRVRNPHAEPLMMSISVCPPCDAPELLDELPSRFDDSVPERTQGIDETKQEAMADRFFQVLVGDQSHRTPVTQFIGKIPLSRAAHHRHLYEETITVLAGEGFMWTDSTKAPVQPGDTIFLPLKQAHSLECTSEGGMRLVGVFYPSGSPAINY